MATKQHNFSKRFKKISKKNATTLTFGEKSSKISATKAITTLLDRSDTNKQEESVYDVISAFSTRIRNVNNDRYERKREQRRQKHNKRHQKKAPEAIEYLEKDAPKQKIKRTKTRLRTLDDVDGANDDDILLETSSNSLVNNEDDDEFREPPKKKQKVASTKDVQEKREAVIRNTVSRDYYKLHWNQRLSCRETQIYPLIKKRRSSAMKSMEISSDHADYWCFIDRDCSPFPISHHITSPSLNMHRDIISAHVERKRGSDLLHATDGLLLSAMSTYRDLFFCDQNYENDFFIKRVLTQHFLSHLVRNEEIRRQNTMRLGSLQTVDSEECRDSGFKRLSVLIVTPFKSNVRQFAAHILANLPRERRLKLQRYKQFEEEYGSFSVERGRGKEYEVTFSGNTDDDFWCGMAIEERGVNFLQNWYYSDIVFMSPLRLKLIFDAGKTADGRSVFDFFSSIEILMIDECDVIEMQNIEHLFDTLHKINWHPKLKKEDDLKRVNFNRLRYCLVDDVAQFYRQNIWCTKYQTPRIKQLFEKRALNVSGRIKIQPNLTKYEGVLHKVVPFVKQEFIRYDAADGDINETRLEMYKKYMLPIAKKYCACKILIFVQSYYDFLRLRRLYKKVRTMRFLSEYTTKSDQIKYRKEFRDSANQNVMYLVITERYYFYNRIRCDGAACVFFFSLPQNKEYYHQILNWFDTRKQYRSYALYSKYYDKLALLRVVGAQRMNKMVKQRNAKQIFV